jgi:diguanylate cyclase (GGDEF)-like protein
MTAASGTTASGNTGVDHVTGLATRSHLEAALAAGLPSGSAFVLCDVVGLKQVNESLGFRAGDECLRRAADRFRAATAGTLLVARLGGDELLAVFAGPGATDRAAAVSRALRERGEPPLRSASAPVPPGVDPWPVVERLYAALRHC